MPTYDYVCNACDHGFENFQGIHDPVLRKCPECGRRTLRRLFGSGAGIVFRGSGFYETDYKRAVQKNAKGTSSKDGEKKPTKTSDGKPKPSGGSDTGSGGGADGGGSSTGGSQKSDG